MFGTVQYDWRFGHETRSSEIYPKTTDSKAEDMTCHSQRFAAVCRSRHELHEDRNYQWCSLGLWVQPGNKTQASQWEIVGSPRPKEVHQVQSKVEVMLTVFCNHKGVFHCEYTPDGHTVNEYCVEVLRRLHNAVQCKQPVSWKRGDRKLHHDNATVHSSQLVQNFLVKHQILQVLQSPCLQCDFFLLPKKKYAVEEE